MATPDRGAAQRRPRTLGAQRCCRPSGREHAERNSGSCEEQPVPSESARTIRPFDPCARSASARVKPAMGRLSAAGREAATAARDVLAVGVIAARTCRWTAAARTPPRSTPRQTPSSARTRLRRPPQGKAHPPFPAPRRRAHGRLGGPAVPRGAAVLAHQAAQARRRSRWTRRPNSSSASSHHCRSSCRSH